METKVGVTLLVLLVLSHHHLHARPVTIREMVGRPRHVSQHTSTTSTTKTKLIRRLGIMLLVLIIVPIISAKVTLLWVTILMILLLLVLLVLLLLLGLTEAKARGGIPKSLVDRGMRRRRTSTSTSS